MTSSIRNYLSAIALVALGAHSASAQGREAKDSPAALRGAARVSLSAARATALAAVPGGRVMSSELEREDGRLVYSFDVATKGKAGIDEVLVDAITGVQVGPVVHESPAEERREAAQEAKEQRSHKAPPTTKLAPRKP